MQTKSCQAPLSMGFFRQEYQSGLPFPSPGDLPDSGGTKTLIRSAGFSPFTLCLNWWPARANADEGSSHHRAAWPTCCSAGTGPRETGEAPDSAASLCLHLQSEGFTVHPPDVLVPAFAQFRAQGHGTEEERNLKPGD